MYVCLCLGITTETVRDAVDDGASTSRQVAAACGAGSQCGRCRRTVRAIIESQNGQDHKHRLFARVKQLTTHH
jgi:bacterioferritin-associated ferredoxin